MKCFVIALCLFSLSCGGNAPTRSVVIGYVERDYVDGDRKAWNADAAWPLPGAIWYPAAASAEAERFAVGPPGVPFLLRGWVARDAPIATIDTPLPLILLSHGTGGARSDLSWLAEPLVEAGYLVAGVTHHGNSIAQDDLTVQGFFLFWERAREMSVLLDRLLEDPTFGPRIDRKRIGVAGFSLGGNTATLLAGARLDTDTYYALCQSEEAPKESCEPPPESPFDTADLETLIENDARVRDSIDTADDDWRDTRIRAAYAIAPAVLVAVDLASVERMEVPVRIAVGDRDTMAPIEGNSGPFAEALPDGEMLVLTGADHYTFIGECGWAGRVFLGEICEVPPSTPRRPVLERVARDAIRFFDDALDVPERSPDDDSAP